MATFNIASEYLNNPLTISVKTSAQSPTSTGKTVTSNLEELNSQLNSLGTSLKAQLNTVNNLSGNSAVSYLNSKVDSLKQSLTSTTTITLGALIGDIAPLCNSPGEVFKNIKYRISDKISDIKQTFGQYATDIKEINDSLKNLTNIGTYANVGEALGDSISAIGIIFQIVEPLLSTLNISSDMALSYFSGGTTTMHGANLTIEISEKGVQKLLGIAYNLAKRALFNIKISVPSALLGLIDNLSINDAVKSTYGTEYSILNKYFNTDFYKDTINTKNWSNAISEAIGILNGDYSYHTFTSDFTLETETMFHTFNSRLVQSFMTNAITQTNKSVGIISDTSSIGWTNANSNGSVGNLSVVSDNQNIATDISTPTLDIMLSNDNTVNPLYIDNQISEENVQLISKNIFNNF